MRILIAIFVLFSKICNPYEMFSEYSKNTYFHYDQFWDICPDFKSNNTMRINNVMLRGTPPNMVFDFVIELTRDLPKFSIAVEIERCRSKEALDTCVKLTTLRTTKVCSMLASEKDFWSPTVQCTKPKYHCYPKQGVYNGTGCYFNLAMFKWFPLSTDYYWRFKLLAENKATNEILFCHLFNGKLENKKN